MSSHIEPTWREHIETLYFQFGPVNLGCLKIKALSLASNPFLVPSVLPVPLRHATAIGCRGVTRAGLPVDKNFKTLCFEYGALRYVAHYGARYVVDLDQSFEVYLTKFSKKSRGNLRRTAMRFADPKTGAPGVQEYRSPAEMAEFRNIAIAISHRSYKTERDWGFPEDENFAAQLTQDAAVGLVRGYILRADNEPAAYVFCRIDHDVIIYKHIGYVERFSKMSPGTALLFLLLKHLFEVKEFRLLDFDGAEYYPYKEFFGTRKIPCARVFWFSPSIANVLLVSAHYVLTEASRTASVCKNLLVRRQSAWSSIKNSTKRRFSGSRNIKHPSPSD
jgi:hypothetical protein